MDFRTYIFLCLTFSAGIFPLLENGKVFAGILEKLLTKKTNKLQL